jgi:hypothetical protein
MGNVALVGTTRNDATATAVHDAAPSLPVPRARRLLPIPLPIPLRGRGGAATAPGALAADAGATAVRLRRCTFRRLDLRSPASGARPASYAVSCLYEGPGQARPLGGLAEATPACASCTLTGVFRADED